MQIKIFLGANVSGKGAFFYVWGHLVLGAFVNGAILKLLGAYALVKFENVF